ncbi:MAG: hydrolase [Gemmatimonadales bacterium]|jgi:8-oxo-dGTP pyrophosphatase MutT (NUDIX family)|nr:hydrolase [Gemmatimonadales bacterium]
MTTLFEHPEIVKLRSALDAHKAVGGGKEKGRRAAVALIFRAGEGGAPELLFIKRAEYPADPWSGQVAFPGGREEAGDASLSDTASRETREETGIDLRNDGTVIGTLDDLRPQTAALPAIIVRPYVVLLKREDSLLLSDEVALAFWVPLAALRQADSWRDTPVYARGIQLSARAFHHEGHVIWGMTERILAQLLALLD